ncbi:DUF1971 domain-containing protein, partial [Spirulina sp.]
MKPLPPTVIPYQRTAEFTETSIPAGLRHAHTTKAGVWGKIIVLAGSLTYRILEPDREEVLLCAGDAGVIEPQMRHEVIPQAGLRFYVQFYLKMCKEDSHYKASPSRVTEGNGGR